MKRADEQLREEATYPHLAAFLQSGGTLEVGESFRSERSRGFASTTRPSLWTRHIVISLPS